MSRLTLCVSGQLLRPALPAADRRHGVPAGGQPVQLRGGDQTEAEPAAQLPGQGPRAQVRDESTCHNGLVAEMPASDWLKLT